MWLNGSRERGVWEKERLEKQKICLGKSRIRTRRSASHRALALFFFCSWVLVICVVFEGFVYEWVGFGVLYERGEGGLETLYWFGLGF